MNRVMEVTFVLLWATPLSPRVSISVIVRRTSILGTLLLNHIPQHCKHVAPVFLTSLLRTTLGSSNISFGCFSLWWIHYGVLIKKTMTILTVMSLCYTKTFNCYTILLHKKRETKYATQNTWHIAGVQSIHNLLSLMSSQTVYHIENYGHEYKYTEFNDVIRHIVDSQYPFDPQDDSDVRIFLT